MPTDAYRTLYDVAEDQMGFVTTAQAAENGVHPMTLVMMTNRGALERVSRGVYRLVDFPVQPLTQYMQATLWPYGKPGVLSHETALSLYELSDADPQKVHITVPRGFRIQRKCPPYLVIHPQDLPTGDVTRLERLPITTPARTIRDCIRANIGPALLVQAVDKAHRHGMMGAGVVAELEAEIRGAAKHEKAS